MSWKSRTVADQKAALAALALAASTFNHLPAPEFRVSRLYPNRLTISLHDDLGDFEAWREAMSIPTARVSYDTQPDSGVLTATAEWGGALVELLGYGPLPKDDDTDGGES